MSMICTRWPGRAKYCASCAPSRREAQLITIAAAQRFFDEVADGLEITIQVVGNLWRTTPQRGHCSGQTTKSAGEFLFINGGTVSLPGRLCAKELSPSVNAGRQGSAGGVSVDLGALL